MSQAHLESLATGGYQVKGELTFATVPGVWQSSQGLFGSDHLYFDLAQVTRADSAALALVLEWLRLAQARGVRLRLGHVPPQLLAVAKVSGVESLLPLDEA